MGWWYLFIHELELFARAYGHYRRAPGPSAAVVVHYFTYVYGVYGCAHKTPVKAGSGGSPARGRAWRADGTHTSLSLFNGGEGARVRFGCYC